MPRPSVAVLAAFLIAPLVEVDGIGLADMPGEIEATAQETAQKATAPLTAASEPAGKVQQAELANGLHLMVIEDHRLPEFVLQLHMQGAGAYFDPPDKVGLASVAAAVAHRSTRTKSFDDLVDLWKEWDADINMVSRGGSTVTVLGGKAASRNLLPYTEIVGEIVRTPQFTAEDIEAVKGRVQTLTTGWKSNPRFLLDEAFLRALYGRHPAGIHEPLASPAVNGLTPGQLTAFAQERYVPEHAVLAIAGDVTFTDVKKLVEKVFGGWRRAGRPLEEAKRPSEPVARLRLVDLQAPQARMAVGTFVASRTESDFDALEVLTSVLGGGTSSRLSTALAGVMPPEAGPADRPGASLASQRLGGTWRVSATSKPESVGQALEALQQQIARLRNGLVPAEELEAAKKPVIQRYLADREASQTRLSNALAIRMLSLPADYWDKRTDMLSAVTPEQIRVAARRYLDPRRLVIAIVGPRATIEPQLKGLSVPVTFVGPDGATIAQP